MSSRAAVVMLFQSTLPMKGATGCPCRHAAGVKVSIHAPNEGSDAILILHNPTARLVSIHAPNEGSDKCRPIIAAVIKVSIHAPNEGSDLLLSHLFDYWICFNPRSQ